VTAPSKTSIRQPLVAYALIFLGAACFITAILFSFASVSSSRRAYRRAIEARLEVLARLPRPEIRDVITGSSLDEPEVSLVSRDGSFGTIPWSEALRLARSQQDDWVVASSPRDPDILLVARLDPTIPTAIAFAAISKTVPFVLLTMLLLAGLYTLATGRLLLPPLDALATIAEQVVEDDAALSRDRAPNEIVEVARKFRQTVRRLRSERERVEEQKRELERMQEGLIRASKLAGIGRLAAGVAHEVGNPLSAVRGYLDLLANGLEPDEEAEVLSRSQKELERIHDTIRGLLTYARSSDDAPRQVVSARRVLEDTLELVRGHPSVQGVDLEVEPGPEPLVEAQPGRLKQVLMNLVLNAAQAMAGRADARVRIAIEVAAERVAFRVSDTGPGVSPELAETIFDPFFTTKPPGEGTGLGLAVSRALMEGMGGDLTLSDSAGAGACFVAWLPRAPHVDPGAAGA